MNARVPYTPQEKAIFEAAGFPTDIDIDFHFNARHKPSRRSGCEICGLTPSRRTYVAIHVGNSQTVDHYRLCETCLMRAMRLIVLFPLDRLVHEPGWYIRKGGPPLTFDEVVDALRRGWKG